MHRLEELVRLHRMGQGAREVARLLGMGPNTERRYREALEAAGLLEGSPDELPSAEQLQEAVDKALPPQEPSQQTSSIADYRDAIEELLDAGLGPQAIHDRLRLQDAEFSGSIGAVKRLVARVRRERGVQATDVAIPVVTAPGDVAQVDFGYAGRLVDPVSGKKRRAWVFVMVLGHSRKMWAHVVFDQRTETWLRLHEEAFAALGGVPRTLVPDNLKAAVIRTAFAIQADDASLNRSYVELARHYGFVIDPTPPFSPQKKGKVEAGVRYVCRNGLAGREGESIVAVNAALDQWVVEVADARVHGTTRRVPAEVFAEEEKPALLPLPRRLFEMVTWQRAKVHRDSHVVFDHRAYSVPWRLIGESVWVRATATTVSVHTDVERVATHRRRGETYRSTVDDHLPEYRRDYRHRDPALWRERAEAIGEHSLALVNALFAEGRAMSRLRTAIRLVTLLEKYPRERAEAACRRALHFDSHDYASVKRILRDKLDLEPLPDEQPAGHGTWSDDQPRFARSFAYLTSPGGEA